jgi:hypothetical protein
MGKLQLVHALSGCLGNESSHTHVLQRRVWKPGNADDKAQGTSFLAYV